MVQLNCTRAMFRRLCLTALSRSEHIAPATAPAALRAPQAGSLLRRFVASDTNNEQAASGEREGSGGRKLKGWRSRGNLGVAPPTIKISRQAVAAAPAGKQTAAYAKVPADRGAGNVDLDRESLPGQPVPRERKKPVEQQVREQIENIQGRSRRNVQKGTDPVGDRWKFRDDWRRGPGFVPYRYRINDPEIKEKGMDAAEIRAKNQQPYTDYTGLRFPSLGTAENFDYHNDRGFDRVKERSFPIKVPGYRRLDPYLREYIHFLHNLDPVRFTVARIAERYRMREKTVAKVCQEWAVSRYLTRSGLTRLRDRQTTKEAVILRKKEEMYARWVGWDQLGDQDDPEPDSESALGTFQGWRSTSDWIRRQTVEVEMMSAFPMMEKRNPMPKRVDVDMAVGHKRSHKIINWIDPNDKVVF